MNRAYLSLGSNINPEQNLRAAIELLATHTRLLAVSSVWETAPVGITDQPNFLNAAALIATDLRPSALKWQVLRVIEAQLHRDRSGHRFGPRTIDIDLVLFNNAIFELDGSPIPDPDVLARPFVAIPLAEIAPAYRHPETGQPLETIAAAFHGEKQKMTRRDDINLNIERSISG